MVWYDSVYGTLVYMVPWYGSTGMVRTILVWSTLKIGCWPPTPTTLWCLVYGSGFLLVSRMVSAVSRLKF